MLTTGALALMCIVVFFSRRRNSASLSERARSIMASIHTPFRKPQPYSPCEQKTTTQYTSYLKRPDGEDVCPTIIVTTPDTRGNMELRRQTKRMGRRVSRDARGRDMLPLPSRGFTSTQRRGDRRHANLQRDRPSYVQRLSQSQPPPVARPSTEEEGYAGKHEDGEMGRASSMPPQKEVEVEENPRSFELPIRPARVSAGASLSDEMAQLSLKAHIEEQDSQSVERGRRTTKVPRPRKDSSSDSDSWKRRGRSKGPRPKPDEEEALVEEIQQESEEEEAGQEDVTEGAGNGERHGETGMKRCPGWVPAQEPESDK